MKRLSNIFAFAIFIFTAMFFSGCQSPRYKPTKEPQIMEGKMKCTISRFTHEKYAKPYLYAFYDIDGKFVSYIDFSNMVMSNVEQYIDKNVVMRGVLTGTPDGNVLKADMIKFSR